MEIRVLLSTGNKSKVTFQSEETRDREVKSQYGGDAKTVSSPIATLTLSHEDWINAGRPTQLCIVPYDYQLH